MEIITTYATKNRCYQAAKKITPKGIVVHSTGANNPNLKRYVDAPATCGININKNHWNRSDIAVCVHSFIGYDVNKKVAVANILPYTYRCWGVGSGKNGSFNDSHIQFEICEDNLKDEDYFNKVWSAAVEYCVYLCKKFSLDPLGKNVIVGHYEAYKLGYGSNHGDPEHWFKLYGKNMDKFRQAVKDAMGETETKKPTHNFASDQTSNPASKIDFAKSHSKLFNKTFTVTASGLNMRRGAGTTKGIIKVLKKGEEVRCYGYYTECDSNIWLYVKDSTGALGFCSKKYLK